MATPRFWILLVAVAAVAATFSLLGQVSAPLLAASTVGGVILSFLAGVVTGGLVGRTWATAAIDGAAAGLTNAFVGIGVAMIVRDVAPAVLAGGSMGGIVVGALGGLGAHAIRGRGMIAG